MVRLIFLVVFVAPLAACGGGGGSGGGGGGGGVGVSVSCQAMGGSVNWGFVIGGITNDTAVADGNLGTFATVMTEGGGFVNTTGTEFPGGTNAGVFLTPPEGFSASDVSLSTYLGLVPVETAAGPLLSVANVSGVPPTTYVSFDTTLPFDRVELTIAPSPGVDYLIFEFCGSATLE